MQIGIDKETLTQELRRLGIGRAMDMLVHSSLSSIGWVEGGAETVIHALLSAVSPAGTILMPALNGSPEDSPQNPTHMREEMVGNAYCRLIHAGLLRQVILPILKQDPLWLLSSRARERFLRSVQA